jgi:hydrogenase maturation protease
MKTTHKATSKPTYKILVIGYGNTLRGDDSVGPLVAERLIDQAWPDVRCLAVHQLTPELAADMAIAEEVFFVDASVRSDVDHHYHLSPERQAGEIALPRIEPLFLTTTNTTEQGHAWSPGLLLHLCQILYQADPVAYQILIPAQQFDYGASLSAQAQAGQDWTVATLYALISDPDSAAPAPADAATPPALSQI